MRIHFRPVQVLFHQIRCADADLTHLARRQLLSGVNVNHLRIKHLNNEFSLYTTVLLDAFSTHRYLQATIW